MSIKKVSKEQPDSFEFNEENLLAVIFLAIII